MMNVKNKSKPMGQYLSENHSPSDDIDDFLEETAPLIGYIVYSFNSLDSLLNSAICELITEGTDGIGSAVIHKMNFSPKVDLFSRLVRLIETGMQKDISMFNTFIEDLKMCATLRNAVIHADWETTDEDRYAYINLNFDKVGINQKYQQFTPETLEEIYDFIEETAEKFDLFTEETDSLFSR
ncbi:MAG: hypothetical protein WC753_00730 [Candidatus Gracilibacteria bacterium]